MLKRAESLKIGLFLENRSHINLPNIFHHYHERSTNLRNSKLSESGFIAFVVTSGYKDLVANNHRWDSHSSKLDNATGDTLSRYKRGVDVLGRPSGLEVPFTPLYQLPT